MTRFSGSNPRSNGRVFDSPCRRYFSRRTEERSLGADALVLPTGVEKVALDFHKPTQRWLDRMTPAKARRHQADAQFDAGSMGPKIAALIDFVGGGLGLITNPPNVARALRGETGTRVGVPAPMRQHDPAP